MRKLSIVVLLVLMLCGCQKTENFETVTDQVINAEQGPKMQIMVELPDEAALEVMESSQDCSVYICDDYSLTVSTVEGGDLRKTVLEATGFYPEQLDGITTQHGEFTKYVCVWAAAGESGQQIGRCAVIDDGSYHYVLTALADADKAGILTREGWQTVFRSFRLIKPEDVVSSGS